MSFDWIESGLDNPLNLLLARLKVPVKMARLPQHLIDLLGR